MKKLFAFSMVFMLMFTLAACGGTGNSASQEITSTPGALGAPSESSPAPETSGTPDGSSSMNPDSESAKVLVAYFSYSGTTRTIAEQIHEQVGGNIFEIKTTYEYPADHNGVLDHGQKELRENARPDLNAQVENMTDYDTVFIGYPIWWGDMPMAVYSFLDEYDLSGKTIIPFCTHGGSGFSNTISSIENAEPSATVLDGLAISASNVSNAQNNVTDWLRELEMTD